MQTADIPVVEIQMPSDASECYKLRKVVCRLATATLRDPGAVADVELAVGEAFGNAVKHGAKNGKVSVKVEPHRHRELAVEMAYSSGPFDTAVTYPQNILEGKGGLGRYIMRQILDGMEYSFDDNGGTTLRMTKRYRRMRNR
jgi:anti-sigma regulatory factor (Ser/Thr protein kinase)